MIEQSEIDKKYEKFLRLNDYVFFGKLTFEQYLELIDKKWFALIQNTELSKKL